MIRKLYKYSVRTILLISILAVFISSIAYSLIASEIGTRWLVNTIVNRSDNTLSITGISGTLLSPLTIDHLTYTSCNAAVSIHSLKLKWHLKYLFHKKINIKHLRAQQVKVNHHKDCDQIADVSTPNPDSIDLPVDISLHTLSIDKLTIKQNDNVQTINNINVNANVKNNLLDVELVNLDYLSLNLYAQLTTKLKKPFQSHANLKWAYLLDNQEFKGALHLDGTIEKIDLTHVLQNPYIVNTALTINDPLNNLTFESTSKVDKATLVINAQQTVKVYDGLIQTSGTIDEIVYQLSSQIDSSTIKDIKVAGSGKITSKLVTLNPLSIQYDQANLTVIGEVKLDNEIQAQLTITGSKLDPAIINSNYPGKLTLDSLITYTQNKTEKIINVSVNQITGVLRDYRVNASGEFQSDLERTHLKNINLSVGENTITAKGIIDQSINVSLNIKAPKIEQLIPNAEGQLQGDIIVKGSIDRPTIKANLSSKSISYKDILNIKNATFDVNMADAKDSSINAKLIIDEFVSEQNSIKNIVIDINGTLEKHQLKADLSSEYGALRLQANGIYDDATQSWSSNDNQISITDTKIGKWSNSSASNISISASSQSIEKLCLHQNQEFTCLSYSHNSDKTQSIILEVNQLSLMHTQQLTSDYAYVNGALSADVSLTKNNLEPWMGHANLSVDRLIISPSKQLDIKDDVVFDELQASLSIQETSDFNLNFSSNYGYGDSTFNISSSEGFTKNNINKGLVNLNIPDLTFISAYINDATIKQGEALFDIQFSGPIDDIKIAGAGSINKLSFYIPALGTEYSDSQFTLHTDGFSKLTIQGALLAGDGTLNIEGWLLLSELNNIQYQASIIGSNFPVMDTLDIKTSISPDLTINGNQKHLGINGKLHIPTLHIQLKELPADIVSVSDDEVIMNDNTRKIKKELFKTQGTINLSIGDDADFIGYGLKTDLNGKLKITLNPDQQPVGHGVLNMNNAVYRKYGQTLDINRGKFIFSGLLDDPSLDVQIQRIVDDVTVAMLITGKANDPSTQLKSSLHLTEANKLSHLITGRAINDLNSSEGNDLSNAALLLGLERSSSTIQEISTKFGFNNVSIEAGDEGLLSTSLLLGKYLSPKLYISYAKDLFSSLGAIQVNYSLTNNISVEVESGTEQTVDLIYSISTD